MLETVVSAQPLREWTKALVARRGATNPNFLVPHFDPADTGVGARVLFLLEAPGPMTNATNLRPGSGFISVDNNDGTAANIWALRNEAGLHEGALHWNIVPWYLGVASRKPTAAELRQGGTELLTLLPLLGDLCVVVVCGRVAQRGWKRHVAPFVGDRLTVIETWHPSPLAMNQAGKREALKAAVERAAAIAL
ncbi:hypothetical protein JF66_20160 [Cryobacterium sp. MLB-32]|nr:hypothetical protein JF66_20160 [Cryobacterium sp. MLB-32]